MLKSVLVFLIAFCVTVALPCGAQNDSGTAPASPAPTLSVVSDLESGARTVKIVCFGDSITGVYYHTGGQRAWCDMLGLALIRVYPNAKLEMINAGKSGHTTIEALKRIDKDVLSKKPQLVVIMFGMNDIVRLPAWDYGDNLGKIIKQVRAAGAEPVLCTPNPIEADDVARTNALLTEYSNFLFRTAAELNVPVVNLQKSFREFQAADEHAFLAIFSDTIHPNMHGHVKMAEEMASTISGKRVVLGNVPPPSPSIPRTLSLLASHAPIRVVAMPPYDRLITPVLKAIAPDAHVDVTTWNVEGKTLDQINKEIAEWGWHDTPGSDKKPKADLVIVALPATASAPSPRDFHYSYTWILNESLSFGYAEWDMVPVLPSVAQPKQTPEQQKAERAALEIIQSQDIGWIERNPNDTASAEKILSRWFEAQAKAAKTN
jgi:acyl-CoA thioesterase-1